MEFIGDALVRLTSSPLDILLAGACGSYYNLVVMKSIRLIIPVYYLQIKLTNLNKKRLDYKGLN